MDFTNRNNNGQAQTLGGQAPGVRQSQPGHSNKRRSPVVSKLLKVASVALLFSITILLVFLAYSFVVGSPRSEKSYINDGRMQAVFLNGGQVYFGNITDLNSRYLRLTNIFYLRVNQAVQPDQSDNNEAQNDISLVKLGCEIHRPTNEMIINREQVVFWENLKDESGENTVPGAVKKYLAQYPNGQACVDAAASGSNNNSSNPSDESSTE